MYVGKLDVFNCTDRASRRNRKPSRPVRTVLATNAVFPSVQSAEIRHQRLDRLGRPSITPMSVCAEIAAIVRRIGGSRLIEEGFLRDEAGHQAFRRGSRHARSRSRRKTAGLAAWHQQECARQKLRVERSGELDRVSGSAEHA
jgi:hypothetical protein